VEHLDKQLPDSRQRATTASDRVREVDDFFADIDQSLPPDTPVLSQEATTREGIYGDILERA